MPEHTAAFMDAFKVVSPVGVQESTRTGKIGSNIHHSLRFEELHGHSLVMFKPGMCGGGSWSHMGFYFW